MQQRNRWRTGMWSALLALALVFSLLPLGGAVQAAGGEVTHAAEAAEHDGAGTLVCRGAGVAFLDMGGHLHVHTMGGGNATILNAETVRAIGAGRRVDRGAWTFLYGWRGEVHVSGHAFQANLVGRNMAFVATGKGRARVRGHGTCQVGDRVFELGPRDQDIPLS